MAKTLPYVLWQGSIPVKGMHRSYRLVVTDDGEGGEDYIVEGQSDWDAMGTPQWVAVDSLHTSAPWLSWVLARIMARAITDTRADALNLDPNTGTPE